MRWTDTSICYRHPEYRERSESAPLLRAMDEAGIGEAWVFGYEAVATHAFEQANDDVGPPCRSNTRTASSRSGS